MSGRRPHCHNGRGHAVRNVVELHQLVLPDEGDPVISLPQGLSAIISWRNNKIYYIFLKIILSHLPWCPLARLHVKWKMAFFPVDGNKMPNHNISSNKGHGYYYFNIPGGSGYYSREATNRGQRLFEASYAYITKVRIVNKQLKVGWQRGLYR